MANITEWFKGTSFFLFVTLMFYFLWNNIFSNIIEFLGTDIFAIGSEADTSIAILKGVTWVSFILLYLSVGGVYLIYSIIAGSRDEITTHPIELLKAIGLWCILMPILSFLYGLTHFLVTTLNDSDIIVSSSETVASQFSWIFSLIILFILVFVPFIYILKGYGIELTKKIKEQQ